MEGNSFNRMQVTGLVALRLLAGWLFLYEGMVKVLNPDWTSAGFLLDSGGFLSGFFRSLAADPATLSVVDFMNEWGLVAIGLGLITGCLTRVALVSGMVLLGFYYLSHPPVIGARYAVPSEGSYLWVNKNLIQLVAMFVLYHFPTEHILGIDRFIFRKRSK
ncbi:MAG: DoxX family membrane protein [Bacteroidales bacterium]|nr:DoxX family membrane protein [Bacteroidales bacterium]